MLGVMPLGSWSVWRRRACQMAARSNARRGSTAALAPDAPEVSVDDDVEPDDPRGGISPGGVAGNGPAGAWAPNHSPRRHRSRLDPQPAAADGGAVHSAVGGALPTTALFPADAPGEVKMAPIAGAVALTGGVVVTT
ncbi:MAG: hypothetical protein M3Q65_04010, partial [Chloroflexota bacterium]|nr:hypothetical protein [Chloroflexota bacterium]